ncbi:MAG: ornithine carbamoyltransferase [Candidatus Helarchaeota archaeon]
MHASRHFLTLMDYSSEELRKLLELAKDIKAHQAAYRQKAPLTGKSLMMIFQKHSTRTRITTELAMTNLGGTALFLGKDDIHLGVNETIRDTASFLGRISSGIIARVYHHDDLIELANYAGIPVINALSDRFHPLQTLADLLTIMEYFDSISQIKIAWIGDGNNVCQSLMIGSAKLNLPIAVASPPGYEPQADVVAYCKEANSAAVVVTNDPKVAIRDADVVVTDTFISMGEESQAAKKLPHFKNFQVNSTLTAIANSDFIFMHCLPRHKEEVTDEIFYGPHSVVFIEAENRLYTVAAVLLTLLQD